MTDDISNMTYPMVALCKVTIGKREYAAGTRFDAETISRVNFLKKTQSAQMLAKPVATRKVAEPVADVVKTEAASVPVADSTESKEVPVSSAGAKGTSNASSKKAASAQSPASTSPGGTNASPGIRKRRTRGQ